MNANTGDVAWRSPLGLADVYGEAGKKTGTVNIGGSVATGGGLVFIGATVDSRFRAFDSHTGREVWTAMLPGPASSTPMTYRGKSGRQYVVVPSGGPGTLGVPGKFASYHAVLIAYALPKAGDAPVDLARFNAIPMQIPQRPPAGIANASGNAAAGPGLPGPVMLPEGPGKEDVTSMCGQCHGVSTAIAVRRSPEAWHDLIQDMRARGAQGDNAKAARVQDYLSQYFGPMAAPVDATPVHR